MNTPDDNNNDSGRMNKRRIRPGFIYLIALVLMSIFFYFIIRQYTEASREYFYDADLYSDTDNDNVYDDGKLYDILENGKDVSINVQIHTEGGYLYISGSYLKTADSGSTSTQTFIAYITLTNDEAIDTFNDIISTRTYSGSQYYTSDNFSYTDYTTQKSFLDYLPSILIWAVIIFFAFYLINSLSKSMGSASSQQFNFNSSRAKRETHSKVRFKDVAGCDEVKAELSEMVDYFHNAKKYTRLGAKLPKGILLQGPPGTGKTLLAKAVAGEADVPFYAISGSDFVEMYVGVGAGRVRDMFRIAKQNAPCLIFIDEIDAVGRQRGAGMGGGNDEREQTLNQLLVEMDGFEENSGIIVMAATNRSDVLDPALMRAGRFDRVITVDLPDKDGREAILKVHSRNKIVAADVDMGAIATRTVGFSGADLANILNDAAILAVRENKPAIQMDDIDEAIDRSIAGPAKTNRGMSQEEKKRVAYHEAGHAVIGIRLQHSEKVQRITIIPRGRTGGHVLMTPENDRFLLTKQELIAQITGLLGGRTSEEIFFGDISTGASNDIEQATNIAREMVVEYGMSDLGPIQYEKNSGSVFLGRDYTSQQARYSSAIALEIDKAVRKIIDEAHDQATELLKKYKDDVELIAKTLMDKETITAEQIDYLIEHRELPPKPVAPAPVAPAPESGEAEAKPAESEAKTEAKAEEIKVEVKPEPVVASPYADKPEVIPFINTLQSLKAQAGLICLFIETDDGKPMTGRTAKKIINDSTKVHVERIMSMGETPSQKVFSTAKLYVEKKIWKQIKSDPKEFGQFVENTTGVEVIFVAVNSESFAKLKKADDDLAKQAVPHSLNKDAKTTATSLKDLVNKDDDKDDKK